MKTFKKLAIAAMVGAVLMGSVHAQGAGKTIGVAVPNLSADFFTIIKQGVESAGKAQGYKVVVVDAKNDAATQVNQIQDLITQKIDALIYIPAGATAAAVPVRAARKAGIPVINVDRNVDSDPGDTFIYGRNIAATTELGQLVCKNTGGKAKVVMIHGQRGTTPEKERTEGFTKGLASCGLKVSQQQWTERWSADEGNRIAQDMLQRDPSINVIIGQADGIAMGASQAVKLAKVPHKVWIIGFDGDPGALEAMKKTGALDATATQQTWTMGKMAVDAVTSILAGKPVPKDQPTEALVTTKDNVDKFIANHP